MRFLGDLAARAFVTIPVEDDDWLRIAELVSRSRDLPLGTVDASIVAAAERLGIVTIARPSNSSPEIAPPGAREIPRIK